MVYTFRNKTSKRGFVNSRPFPIYTVLYTYDRTGVN